MAGNLVVRADGLTAGLTKPATVLINKVSDAMGGIARPYQIERVAKAEAKAAMIRAESEIEIGDLQFRAATRFVQEETRKQLNMENITRKALPLLTDDASPQDMEDDWILNFFDKSRLFSDEEMQELWARILAGEANTPGTFSRRTINIMSDMEKRDADMFRRLCRFLWTFNGEKAIIFFVRDDMYKGNGLSFQDVSDLASLGLIALSEDMVFKDEANASNILATYFSEQARIVLKKVSDSDHMFICGDVMPTEAGRQLASICDTTPINGMFQHTCEKWQRDSHVESVEVL